MSRAMMYSEGVFSSRPSAATAGNGGVYFATDTGNLYHSNGAAWTLVGSTSGGVTSVFSRSGAVVAAAGDYYGIVAAAATGATAASQYVGATTSGAPASGTHAVGDFVVDRTGSFWICTTGGTPGTWTQVAAGTGGPPTGAAGGVLDGTYPNPGLAAGVAGAGLAEASDVLSVNVDGSTIEINSDTLRVKAGGIGANELASTAVTPATYGDATNVGQFTVDADGRITSAVSIAIPGAGGGASDGWTDDTAATWTYASASTFTVTGNRTAVFQAGTYLKFTQTTVKYFVVVSSVHAAGTTTVTVALSDDYTLANAAISANYYSYQANPQGWPGWFRFTPAEVGFSAGASLFMWYAVVNKMCTAYFAASGTSDTTGLTLSLPVPPTTATNIDVKTTGQASIGGVLQATPALFLITQSGTVVTCYPTAAQGNWTASGTKGVQGEITYRIGA